MKPSFVPLAPLLVLAAVLFLGGCASTDKSVANDPNAVPTDSSGQAVSTIPWNKPSSWESGGALGSMMNQ